MEELEDSLDQQGAELDQVRVDIMRRVSAQLQASRNAVMRALSESSDESLLEQWRALDRLCMEPSAPDHRAVWDGHMENLLRATVPLPARVFVGHFPAAPETDNPDDEGSGDMGMDEEDEGLPQEADVYALLAHEVGFTDSQRSRLHDLVQCVKE